MKRVRREWARIYRLLRSLFPHLPETLQPKPDTSLRESPRHFAAVECETPTLYVHPELEDALITQIRGVLTHEAGHIADSLVDDETVQGVCYALGRDYTEDEEVRADILGEFITGWKVWYDPTMVQRAGPGAGGLPERPAHL